MVCCLSRLLAGYVGALAHDYGNGRDRLRARLAHHVADEEPTTRRHPGKVGRASRGVGHAQNRRHVHQAELRLQLEARQRQR